MADVAGPELIPGARRAGRRFSVVTITRNDLAGLRSTWDSLRNQTLDDFEWIVVDGASSDGTVGWLSGLEDPRLTWTSEPDDGIYDAMNKGVTRSIGDLVVFMNGGDRFASPEVLETVARERERWTWTWAYGASRTVDSQGEVLGFQVHAPFSLANLRLGLRVVPHQATYFSQDLLTRLGGYDPSFGIAADQELMLRSALDSRPHVIGVVLAEFLSGGVSYGGRADRFVRETRLMRRRHGLLVGGNAFVDFLATGVLSAERRLRHAVSSMARGTRPG